jgi:RNA polymerase sigma factor (sigma-70 family)
MGDAAAFDILFSRHSGRVQAYIGRRLSDRGMAEDLVQDIFLKLHRSRHQYDKSLPFAPWLFAITRTVLLDHFKKSARKKEESVPPERLDALPANEISGPAAAKKSGGPAPVDLLLALPEAHRRAVSMRLLEDATFDEIAARLATSPANARQLFSRGIKKLRGLFGAGDKRPDGGEAE